MSHLQMGQAPQVRPEVAHRLTGRHAAGCRASVTEQLAGLNAVLVGLATGAYGLPSASYLIHVPLEWLAFGTAIGVYDRADRSGCSIVASALFAGALIETLA